MMTESNATQQPTPVRAARGKEGHQRNESDAPVYVDNVPVPLRAVLDEEEAQVRELGSVASWAMASADLGLSSCERMVRSASQRRAAPGN